MAGWGSAAKKAISMASGVLFGLTAALCWGVADYCARGATRTGGTFLTLLAMQVIAVAAFLVFVAPFGLLSLTALTHDPMPTVLFAAVLNLLILAGAALLYRAFAIGIIALISPIAAGFAAITTLLAILFGERPTPAVIVGLALTLIGVIVASAVPNPQNPLDKAIAPDASEYGVVKGKHRRRLLAPGVVEVLGASVLFGVCYYALRDVTSLGGVTVAFIGKVSDLLALSLLALLAPLVLRGWRAWRGSQQAPVSAQLKMPAHHPSSLLPLSVLEGRRLRRFLVFLAPTALLDTAANVAYNVGIASAGTLTSVVATISSLFSVVTVLLAWVFLRERLALWQWVGVAAIFVGVALVNW